MFGLPFSTFFWVWITPLIAAIIALAYGLSYSEDDNWWTLDELFNSGGERNDN